MNDPTQLEESSIRKWLAEGEIRLGRALMGAVSDLRVEGDELKGRVSVAGLPKPFEVAARFENRRATRMACTCHMGGRCRHVAAVMLAKAEADAKKEAESGRKRPGPKRGAKALKDAQSALEAEIAKSEALARAVEAGEAPASAEAAGAQLSVAQAGPAVRSEDLFWFLGWKDSAPTLRCALCKADADGSPKGPREAVGADAFALSGAIARFGSTRWNPKSSGMLSRERLEKIAGAKTEADKEAMDWLCSQAGPDRRSGFGLEPVAFGRPGSSEALSKLAEAGRLWSEEQGTRKVRLGAPAKAKLGWSAKPDGKLRAEAACETGEILRPLGLDEPMALDAASGELRRLDCGLCPNLVLAALDAGEMTAEAGAAWAEDFSSARALPEGFPLPPSGPVLTAGGAPTPVLRLGSTEARKLPKVKWFDWPWSGSRDGKREYAEVFFEYGPLRVPAGHKGDYSGAVGNSIWKAKRDLAAERAALSKLRQGGLMEVVPDAALRQFALKAKSMAAEDSEAVGFWLDKLAAVDGDGSVEWKSWSSREIPALREAGWKIEFEKGFRHACRTIDAWEASAVDTGAGWFEIGLGVLIEGTRYQLAPLLASLFKKDPRWRAPGAIRQIDDQEQVELDLPDGTFAAAPAGRIKPLALKLADILAAEGMEETLRLDKLDAARVAEALDGFGTEGLEALQAAAEEMEALSKVEPVEPPAGLTATLRPYQRAGLDWMQHLRARGLGGILADDMGLGKTLQVLAHILKEKECGRLDRPALAVLPTSLVFNWESEAKKFAPSLKVLALTGPRRQALFEKAEEADLVITTYPLLWRDEEELAKMKWHLVVLDEAQAVKNAAAKAAKAARRLDTRHRLVVTGTPVENHLGELWSQMDFALPGFLGSRKFFDKAWRTPIEKGSDLALRSLLASKIKPFVLRRTKDEVATDLPPKTVVVRKASFGEEQRDLYEGLRAVMDKKLREKLESEGLAKARVEILDALLKLRQCCCDPSLLPGELGRRGVESAKMELLEELAVELAEEGRKVLVFSQFATMLDAIEVRLAKAGLKCAKLTGQTRDRQAQVKRFQEGDAQIFLISLKAGGVGLNLTAAEAVIHFDPWWNPAAEAQASDRAHRIGQTKPVLVIKLVAENTVEEKILEMQQRKAELAGSMLSEDYEDVEKFGEEDLLSLFAQPETVVKAQAAEKGAGK